MNFDLTDEQKMIQDMARNFADKEVAPLAAELDETHRFPVELAKKMGELGLMGVAVPEQYGGAGMDYVCYAVALEEISRACANTGVIMSVNNSLVCDPILNNATEEQKQRFLAPLAAGRKIGCFGLTEPSAGSDAGNQKTTAVLDGNEWILNGSKVFITNGSHADTMVVFAMTDKGKGLKGISTFIVEKETPGFKVGKIEKKLGLNASGTAELIFEDCRIPKDQLLGQVGQGFKIAMQTLDGGRIGIGAQAVGIARAAMEQSVKYSLERVQFNQPIAKFQAIQWMLADMATEIDAARLLVHRAAQMKDAKQPYSKQSAMAKLFASETAMKTATKAIQIHGGYGYSKEYPVERNFRDAKITEIYEGTSEIQRLVIASHLLK
ncbi:acyl-CoA dehydrogenase [Candidatus Poribacteria bacterium]|nr:acyl-CoA dehydrogenase [Candidatus Poribacteria bacterium]